ncbi:MAG: fumarylacetoacetate hydrolase family protein [Actinomycetia bacterium]|nr:fumarylacetoacetate hydrolase family protein [Actinomycetes bacterium]
MEQRRIWLEDSAVTVAVEGSELVAHDGHRIPEAEAVYLPPVAPQKIICVHLNYRSRVAEYQIKTPSTPTYFHKPVSSLNVHRGQVVRPKGCQFLNYEGEIAIVIGQKCRNVSREDAVKFIGGYTIANDFGIHDFRDTDAGSMLRVKGSDSLCPVGPGVVSDWDPEGKSIRTYVNGDLRQDGNTAEMIWDFSYLVADLARTITLFPGDLILSGTPANSRPVQPGDVVTVEVDGLGALTNTVVEGGAVAPTVGAQPTRSEEVVSTALGGDWEFRGIRHSPR